MKLSHSIKITYQKIFFLIGSVFYISTAVAQTLPLPYEISNLSQYSDEEIYVAMVGKIDGTDVWMDMATGELHEMKKSDNTLQAPIHNGNKGPGGDGKYADSFTPLSDIPPINRLRR